MASEIRVNKIENRSGLGTVTFADTGVDLAGIVTATTFSGSGASLTALPAAQVTGTLPAISGANLTNLPAANLTGTLPAISGANLTGIAATDNVRTGILDVAGIATFRNDVNLPNINGGQIGGRRNLIINGAMTVAQRGTSSTTNGYGSVDRFQTLYNGTDEAPTHAQVDVTSGTTPYTSGFRKAYKITNGNQTGGAGGADYIIIRTILEAQDIANSGWNYLSSSSNITLSFWVKSSVAQNFYGNLVSYDGTPQNYAFETGSLSADTWTKITKTIPGNSNLTFDNNTDAGVRMNILPFFGASYTGSVTLNQWAAYSGSAQTPANTSTWYTTNDATFEITGVQLEVGSTATAFEHRSPAEDLSMCERYFENLEVVRYSFNGSNHGAGSPYVKIYWNTKKRAQATITLPAIGQGTDELQFIGGNGSYQTGSTTVNVYHTNQLASGIQGSGYSGNSSSSEPAMLYGTGTAIIQVSAEI